jgi:dihydrodipicolinate synthase/N-acetylneuraminate lyase
MEREKTLAVNAENIQAQLEGQVVAVPPTVWTADGEVDEAACAENARFLFERRVQAAVYAGGVGEHDVLSVDGQTQLLRAVTEAARSIGSDASIGSGVGRTVERVRDLAPALEALGVHWAMLMPPRVDGDEAQWDYYSQVIPILREHGVWPMLYLRPENPSSTGLVARLFNQYEIVSVKLAHNAMLLSYAAMVREIGPERSAWLCGTAGWWIPAYRAVGAARGMSSGIVNAFPEVPLAHLNRVNEGLFACDETYWSMVAIESIRLRQKPYIILVIKYLQELVGLHGGTNKAGNVLPDEIKREVEGVVRGAGWL